MVLMKLPGLSQNRAHLFWALQLFGWIGWVVLFTIRDLYWVGYSYFLLLYWSTMFFGLKFYHKIEPFLQRQGQTFLLTPPERSRGIS